MTWKAGRHSSIQKPLTWAFYSCLFSSTERVTAWQHNKCQPRALTSPAACLKCNDMEVIFVCFKRLLLHALVGGSHLIWTASDLLIMNFHKYFWALKPFSSILPTKHRQINNGVATTCNRYKRWWTIRQFIREDLPDRPGSAVPVSPKLWPWTCVGVLKHYC